MVLDGVHGRSLWDSWGPWGSLRISYLKITRPWEAGPCWFWEALVRSLGVLGVLWVCSESVIEAIGPSKGLGCFWGFLGRSLGGSGCSWGSLRISDLKVTRPWKAGPCWFWEALVRSLGVLEVLGVCSESVIKAIGPWAVLRGFWLSWRFVANQLS